MVGRDQSNQADFLIESHALDGNGLFQADRQRNDELRTYSHFALAGNRAAVFLDNGRARDDIMTPVRANSQTVRC